MEDLLDYTDYFVIAHGLSLPHLKALAKQVKEASEDLGVRILHVEGYSGLRWMVFDFDSVMVHLFSEEARFYYGLESLWSDASRSMIGEDIVDC